MRTIYLSALLLAISAGGAHAAWAPAERLDAYFDALARNDLTSGSIAISENGELRYQRVIGFARIHDGRRDPADVVTRYRVGTVTELFTAALVMQLAEKASIMLDSPVAEFYPDLPNALRIKYRDLLDHRSGLIDYTDEPTFEAWRRTPRTQAQMLEVITIPGKSFEARERVEESSSNYLVLGYVLEKVYERPYDQVLKRQIVDKLGLQRTYMAGAGSEALESQSYRPKLDGSWGAVPDSDPTVHGGAAGMVSTAADLVRFMDALFAGKVVSPDSLASMRNQDDGSGLGLWPYDVAGQPGFGHRGRVDAYRACVYYFPQRKLSIAVTTNASLLPIDELADEVLTTVFDRRHQPPPLVPVKLTAAQQAEYLGTWHPENGSPRHGPFRSFHTPGMDPMDFRILAGTDAPMIRTLDRAFALVPLGNDEFLAREFGQLLRFYPRSGELVSRGPDWAYYFKRAQ